MKDKLTSIVMGLAVLILFILFWPAILITWLAEEAATSNVYYMNETMAMGANFFWLIILSFLIFWR